MNISIWFPHKPTRAEHIPTYVFVWVWEKYVQNQFVLLGFGIDSNFKWEMFFYCKVCMYNVNWGEIIMYVLYMLLLTQNCVMLMRKKIIPRMSAFS